MVTTAAEETTLTVLPQPIRIWRKLLLLLLLHVLDVFVSWWRSRCREAAAVVEADIVAMAMVLGQRAESEQQIWIWILRIMHS